MSTHANGMIPTAALTRTSAEVLLRADAAASYERLAKRFNAVFGPMYVSDGYRPRTGGPFSQEGIFLARYEPRTTGRGPFGDIRTWQGRRYVRVRGAAAAVPGTSNHGWGIAADFASGINSSFLSAAHLWMVANGPEHGWTNTEGRAIKEPWHWVYDPNRDRHRSSGGGSITPAPSPTPTTSEEDEMTPAEREALFEVRDRLRTVDKNTTNIGRQVWGYVNRTVNGTRDAYALLTETARQVSPILRGKTSTEFRKELADIRPELGKILAAVKAASK